MENELLASRENASREKRTLEEKVSLLVDDNNALEKELKMALDQRNAKNDESNENAEKNVVLEVFTHKH